MIRIKQNSKRPEFLKVLEVAERPRRVMFRTNALATTEEMVIFVEALGLMLWENALEDLTVGRFTVRLTHHTGSYAVFLDDEWQTLQGIGTFIRDTAQARKAETVSPTS